TPNLITCCWLGVVPIDRFRPKCRAVYHTSTFPGSIWEGTSANYSSEINNLPANKQTTCLVLDVPSTPQRACAPSAHSARTNKDEAHHDANAFAKTQILLAATRPIHSPGPAITNSACHPRKSKAPTNTSSATSAIRSKNATPIWLSCARLSLNTT